MVDAFFENKIKKHFDFLVEEYGFSAPIYYNIAYEYHAAYIKDNFFIDIVFDGGYWCTVNKSLKPIFEALSEKKIYELNYRQYYLSQLDSRKKLYKSIQDFAGGKHDKELFYYAMLLKNNPAILNGNFRKFSLVYLLLKKNGLK